MNQHQIKNIIGVVSLFTAVSIFIFAFFSFGPGARSDDGNDETTTTVTTTTEVETTTEAETTTEPGESIDSYLPPANLNQLSQAQQLAYFNHVVNRVHREMPGHTQVQTLRMENITSTGMMAFVQPIINAVVNNLMPGHPETRVRAPGQDVQYYWMSNSPHFGSNLRSQDITSITSTQQDDNWVIEVRVREEENPQHFTSAHGRIAFIQTREEILAAILDIGSISANPEDAVVRYHNGFARIVVNQFGQIIEASNGFDVDARADNVNIGPIRTNLTALQTSRWTYNNFLW